MPQRLVKTFPLFLSVLPTVFFNYIAANGDRQDHGRLLGDNVFGFEDIFGGGDRDFNDVIVKVSVG
ncbi:DUF4114 domain-containing protein [Phormidium sp. FACHB-1136]|nr:DUF4114 domain-containing protein [Phormidium sp. FACHB-1136]